MMITTPYILFKFHYASDPSGERTDRSGLLFYNTTTRQLVELLPPKNRRERNDWQEYPIRVLPYAEVLMDKINLETPEDFTRNKTVMGLLRERHPGPLRRGGDLYLLRVVSENRQVISHRPRWSLQPSGYWDGTPYGCWLWSIPRLNDQGKYRNHVRIRHNPSFYEYNNPNGFMVEPESHHLVPQRTKKQVYNFRSLCMATTTKGKPLGYMIEETCLETDGRSKRGKLTRWVWATPMGTSITKSGPYPVEIQTEQPQTCVIEGVRQRTVRQIFETLDNIIRAHNS